MQTFLPYPQYHRSAASLDMRRLGKQRVENLQIMQTIIGVRIDRETDELEPFDPKGWVNHPAVRMWRGYISSLLDYQAAICAEWTGRGYRDTCYQKTTRMFDYLIDYELNSTPHWLRDPSFHRSHQSNLIRKDPDFYAPQFPGVPDDLEYVWPV